MSPRIFRSKKAVSGICFSGLADRYDDVGRFSSDAFVLTSCATALSQYQYYRDHECRGKYLVSLPTRIAMGRLGTSTNGKGTVFIQSRISSILVKHHANYFVSVPFVNCGFFHFQPYDSYVFLIFCSLTNDYIYTLVVPRIHFVGRQPLHTSRSIVIRKLLS